MHDKITSLNQLAKFYGLAGDLNYVKQVLRRYNVSFGFDKSGQPYATLIEPELNAVPRLEAKEEEVSEEENVSEAIIDV